MDLKSFVDRLSRKQVDATMHEVLARVAAELAESVRESLSASPGDKHDRPWLRTGSLRESIGVSTEGLTAVVGSTSQVAVWQEQGTERAPPRPFLAPAAALAAPRIAAEIGQAVVDTLRS